MNKFVILCFVGFILLNFTNARVTRDVSLGYHYHPEHSSSGSNFLTAPSFSSSTSYSPSASGNSYFNAVPFSGSGVGTSGFVPSTQTYVSGNSGLSSSFSVSSGLGFSSSDGNSLKFSSGIVKSSDYQSYDDQGAFQSHEHAYAHQAPIVTKHFYIHSAPEQNNEQQIVRHFDVEHPQQNYRVVFINAPTSNIDKAKIIANVAPVEDKTAIYVLSKKSNALDVSAEVVSPAPSHHKPEVFFVKYKTPAEAEHAQHVIQAQYDALGGSSHVSNEGIVPVSSVIGSLGGETSAADSGSITTVSGGSGSIGIKDESISIGGGSSGASAGYSSAGGSGGSDSSILADVPKSPLLREPYNLE